MEGRGEGMEGGGVQEMALMFRRKTEGGSGGGGGGGYPVLNDGAVVS